MQPIVASRCGCLAAAFSLGIGTHRRAGSWLPPRVRLELLAKATQKQSDAEKAKLRELLGMQRRAGTKGYARHNFPPHRVIALQAVCPGWLSRILLKRSSSETLGEG